MTRDVYESHAADWVRKRKPLHLDAVESLGKRGRPPSIDLGCGPGWHTGALARPAIAFDVAMAMLELVPDRAPDAWRVQGDLESLPFRSGALGSAWARNSYVHLRRASVPLALADLHRSLRLGAHATIAFFLGGEEGRDLLDGGDFAGRYFSRWELDKLFDVIIGAGFDLRHDDARTNNANEEEVHLELVRARTLPDLVRDQLRILVCGLNPSLYAADAGVGFARPGNRFWPAALASGLVTRDRDPWHALRHHRVGFTDIVKRATVAASELTRDEYATGLARLERLTTWLQPRVVAFVGLAGWRAAVDRRAVAGPQTRTIGGRPVYVMPSSSGLNSHSSVSDLAAHLRAALALA
ncbi:MAG TPA: uracil-DNA glycosylase family protein [Acidimicrobiales bacterium]|nr:uracil-DNA glycosylase family protein [Acidimicrobiales bacterium]